MLEFTQEDYDRLMGLIEASDMDSSQVVTCSADKRSLLALEFYVFQYLQKAFYRKNLVTRYLIYFQTVDKAFEAILGVSSFVF